MTDTPAGYIPPESAPPIDLRAPTPRVKRLNRVAIAAVVAGLGVLISFALVAALRRPDKAATPAKSSTQLVLPADALSDLPTDYAAAAAAQLGAAAQESYGGGISASNPSLTQLAVAGAAQNLNSAGQQIVQKDLQVQPTLRIRPGQRVGVFVTKDIALQPYRG